MENNELARIAKGRISEDRILDEYIRNGYSLLEKNFRINTGEIDLILKKDDTIIFVEVRSKTSTTWGEPWETINKIKKSRIVRAAEYYIYQKNIKDTYFRFDIASVIIKEDNTFEIEIFEDAFTA